MWRICREFFKKLVTNRTGIHETWFFSGTLTPVCDRAGTIDVFVARFTSRELGNYWLAALVSMKRDWIWTLEHKAAYAYSTCTHVAHTDPIRLQDLIGAHGVNDERRCEWAGSTSAWLILVASCLDAKPPNTSEWMAPMRAHANMATIASGIMGM